MTGAAPQIEIVTAESCDCTDGPAVPMLVPEYYDADVKAIRAFLGWRQREAKAQRLLFWAVHLRGKHVLKVAARADAQEEANG